MPVSYLRRHENQWSSYRKKFDMNEMCNEVVGLVRLCLSESEFWSKMLKVAVLFAALRGSFHKVMNESQEQGKNFRHLLKSWNPIVLNEEE